MRDEEGIVPLPIPASAFDLLDYDPLTGSLSWKECRNGNALAGAEAGWVEKGRRRVEIDGRAYLVHRVAYFLHTGEQPPRFLDHKDGDALNNRFPNLRPATRRQNNRNKGIYANNSTGYRGVVYCRESGKYRARIGLGGKKKTIGRFTTPEEASRAYETFARDNFGEFYRPI